MNNYKTPKSKPTLEPSQTDSFISSIFTSINASEQQRKSFLSKSQAFTINKTASTCSCCRRRRFRKQTSFHVSSNTSLSLGESSSSSSARAPLTAPYLTFDVKMASTPILNRRRSFNFEALNVQANSQKHMSTPLATKRQVSSTKRCTVNFFSIPNCDCCSVGGHTTAKKVTSATLLKRPKRSQTENLLYKANKEQPVRLAKKQTNAGLRFYKNIDIITSNVTSSEIVNCNGYLKSLLKKSSSGKSRKLGELQKIQLKKRMQKLNNVSTSTKKEYAEKRVSKKQREKNYDTENNNLKRGEDLKRKAKSEFSKRVKLETAAVAALATAAHLPVPNGSESVLGFNSYFPNACLNKFNQLGQLQVWFV